LVVVSDGSVAGVLGAVTGIESKAVIDGTSLSGAMSQDRFALAPHIKARAAARAEIRELAGRSGLTRARLARGYSPPA
jgi:hypothetical protein